ncbi:redox-regulated ATPase YchF [bacterium]|nr:redox-regulated ATPase YchF [bacterium]
MALHCGIIGLPNVGKSTLFNALTSSSAEASNYPFCTIKSNVGIVQIPDERLIEIEKLITTKKVVPANIEFVDIAGLVKGAHKGEGLGNQFLANILDMDTLVHVVRCFSASDVMHVEGDIDPVRDIEIIEMEILLKDIELIERRIERMRKTAKSGDKTARKDIAACEKLVEILNQGGALTSYNISSDMQYVVDDMKLLCAKPVIYVLNISENDIGKDTQMLETVKKYAVEKGISVVCICSELEEELSQLSPEDRKDFLDDLSINEVALASMIKQVYKTLHIVTFFTANPNELHAWTVFKGIKAPQAAGKIHTDFEKGFIRAEVISYEDYIAYGGEHGAKEHGVMRIEGKDYVVSDGDVVFFRFNI